MNRVIARFILTASEKAQYDKHGHVIIENFNHVTDILTWTKQVEQPHVNCKRTEYGGLIRTLDGMSAVHKDFHLFAKQLEWVAEMFTDEPMSLYRDYILYKHPSQPLLSPLKTQQLLSGVLGLERLTSIMIGLQYSKDFVMSLGSSEDKQTYTPGPLDLLVWEKHVDIHNEENQTDKLIRAIVLVYNRKSDGDQYFNYYKAVLN